MSTFDDRGGSKWDRAARYLRIATVLRAHGDEGISAAALARQIGVSRRTIYRDLEAMDLDGGLPVWNDGGRFGLAGDAFLPPLALTLPEAMAIFLAARLLTKATDELDPELIGALVKLAEVLPPVLAEQLHETATAFSDSTPRDETFTRVLRGLTQALAERRVVEIEYAMTMTRAELSWVRGIVDDIRSGDLPWTRPAADSALATQATTRTLKETTG